MKDGCEMSSHSKGKAFIHFTLERTHDEVASICVGVRTW